MFNEDLMNQFKLMKSRTKDFTMDTKLIFFWIPFFANIDFNCYSIVISVQVIENSIALTVGM